MKRQLQSAIALLIIASLVLAACAAPAATPAAAPTTAAGPTAPAETGQPEGSGQELVWSFPMSQRWDPATSGGFDFYAGNVFIFGTLTRYTASGEIVPWLAESFEVSDDGLEYTFFLRKDLKFNTGTPVTAKDFKFSWERTLELGSAGLRHLANVEGVQAFHDGAAEEITGLVIVDDYTLRVRLIAPTIFFLNSTANGTLGVVEEAQVAKDTPEKRWQEEGGGGAGPYMIESFDPENIVTVLVPNPYYFGERPNLDKITYMNVSDGQTRQLMYESGELDAIYALGLDINALSNPNNPLSNELKQVNAGAFRFFPIRIDKPPFDDPKFREAFFYAVDYAGIVNALFPYFEPLDGIAPPSPVWEYKGCGTSQDVERAKQAFAESSYGGDPSKVPSILIYSTPSGETTRYLQAIQEQVDDVLGVKVELVLKDSISEEELAQNSINGWSAGMINAYPGYYIDLMWWGGQYEYHSRWMTYQSDEVDALIEEAHGTSDIAEYNALYGQVIDTVCSEFMFMPGWVENWYLLVKPYVAGLYDVSYDNLIVDLENVEVNK